MVIYVQQGGSVLLALIDLGLLALTDLGCLPDFVGSRFNFAIQASLCFGDQDPTSAAGN